MLVGVSEVPSSMYAHVNNLFCYSIYLKQYRSFLIFCNRIAMSSLATQSPTKIIKGEFPIYATTSSLPDTAGTGLLTPSFIALTVADVSFICPDPSCATNSSSTL